MLRTSLRSVRGPGGRAIAGAAGRQWLVAPPASGLAQAQARARAIGKRHFADDKKSGSDVPQPAVIPPSETRTAAASQAPQPASQSSVKSASIPTADVPRTPPPPPAAPQKTTNSIPSPPPLPRKKKGFFRRLRNFVLTLSLLGALGFGGGVWYSRVNDNFHDFFTEYVPYGEQAVLYLEEMDFRKRFPRIASRGGGASADKDRAAHVQIPAQSGASWRVADEPEPAKNRSSAAVKGAKSEASSKPAESKKAKSGESISAPALATALAPASSSSTFGDSTPKAGDSISPPASVIKKSAAKEEPSKEVVKSRSKRSSSKSSSPSAAETAVAEFKPPEVDEPSRWPPASPIDPLAVNDATEPVVQDLVRMLNDVITVINADGANDKYGSTIGKAKEEINRVGQKVREMRRGAEEEAAGKVKESVENLQTYATDLIERLESHMAAQEKQWRAEFEAELVRLHEGYEARVRLMTERERQLNEEKLHNMLLEQALDLQRQFRADLAKRVEEERDSRLGRLEDLSKAVKELDSVATGLSDVVGATKRTQQLHVAVDAVRAALEASSTSSSPRPFVKELVALKETAAGDPVVDAAIASINPAAYQRGVASSAELIDRFRRVAAEVRKAALLPADAGVASHASAWALSKVMFRRSGLAADGDDVESVLARAQALLEEGELDAAAREVNGLQGWAKTLSRDWLAEVRKVLEVQQALDVIQTEARLQSLRVEE